MATSGIQVLSEMADVIDMFRRRANAPAPSPSSESSELPKVAPISVIEPVPPAIATETRWGARAVAVTPAPVVGASSDPPADISSATKEIADLLRAAHDNAIRLNRQAEADIRHTVETARTEVDAQRRLQERELAGARELVEHDNARKRHEAQLDATGIRQRAEQDAAAARAAAAALLAQAKAEIEAVQALARYNMAEIEHAKQMSLEQSRQMLSLGRSMIGTIISLDREVGDQLTDSQAAVTEVLRNHSA